MEQAERHMRKAADELDKQEKEPATQEQDRALDQLERAQRELEEALRQLRDEEKEEILRSLEARIAEMVADQKQVNSETTPLHALKVENFTRVEQLKCAELGERQAKLAEAANTCVRLLEEDGTTVVFPRVMAQLAEEMQDLAVRLAGQDVGRLTIMVQEDVLTALTELLESLKRLREEQQNQQRGGGGGAPGGSGAPLVPTSAELKMLKRSQLRVNRVTRAGAEAPADGEAPTAVEQLLKDAAADQAELVELARELQQRSERARP
jgi:hypothetical protein